jgi:ferrous iron transport protein B
MMGKDIKTPVIALLGNPNSGKSSLFNLLTGLRQEVSNFPGVTIDKKVGTITLSDHTYVKIIDFPGTYSLFPNSAEEKIVINTLLNKEDPSYPDALVYVADITQLDRHLILASQVRELDIPMVFVLNMIDLVDISTQKELSTKISKYLGCQVILASVREELNINLIKESIPSLLKGHHPQNHDSANLLNNVASITSNLVKDYLGLQNIYQSKLIAHHHQWLKFLTEDQKNHIGSLVEKSGFEDLRLQVDETMSRYDKQKSVVKLADQPTPNAKATFTDKIDQWITHRFMGPVIFFAIMLFVFQAIFTWSSVPMEWIENSFANLGGWVTDQFGTSWWTDLLVNGILAGLGGVLVFVPQIAILFFLLALLEESGYMSRVVYMFDNIMHKFGMNGRSMVALISSGACAIPAIMSTRTISNPKERLITIMVSPLISCSARLPVYAVLIGFVVPDVMVMGFFQAQGLAFMGLYLLGILGVFVTSLVLKQVIKSDSPSYLMIELPNYKPPLWKNVALTVKEKVASFIIGAGKIIMIISILLWLGASFGPGDQMEQATQQATAEAAKLQADEATTENMIGASRLEASYIGHLGKFIEPAIRPLGYDWKIGIALLTSFAAREVFVGTMSTIYSLGSESDEKTVREKMAAEVRPGTNIKVYNPATSLSLLVFYVFAMQCMSTLAVTKKETNTWKWPIIQFVFMSAMAYVGAFLVYQWMS